MDNQTQPSEQNEPSVVKFNCPRCGEDVDELHHFHLDGGNDHLCLLCCQEEERAWHEDNGQFGVGA